LWDQQSRVDAEHAEFGATSKIAASAHDLEGATKIIVPEWVRSTRDEELHESSDREESSIEFCIFK